MPEVFSYKTPQYKDTVSMHLAKLAFELAKNKSIDRAEDLNQSFMEKQDDVFYKVNVIMNNRWWKSVDFYTEVHSRSTLGGKGKRQGRAKLPLWGALALMAAVRKKNRVEA